MRKISLFLALSIAALVITGCYNKKPNTALAQPYNNTDLSVSGTADVLSLFQTPEAEKRAEILSQTDTVVASWGEARQGNRQWLNAVAFDEHTALAQRKYFFWVDEKARNFLLIHPKWSSQFNAEVIVDPAVMDKPYASEEARQIAVAKFVLKSFQDDLRKVVQTNKMLDVCRDTVNQYFNSVLHRLDESPALAQRLSTPDGLSFSDAAFYKGNLKLETTDNTATVLLRAGALVDNPMDPNNPQTTY